MTSAASSTEKTTTIGSAARPLGPHDASRASAMARRPTHPMPADQLAAFMNRPCLPESSYAMRILGGVHFASYGDSFIFRGPIRSADGADNIGTALLLELPDRAAADKFWNEA